MNETKRSSICMKSYLFRDHWWPPGQRVGSAAGMWMANGERRTGRWQRSWKIVNGEDVQEGGERRARNS